MLNSFEELCIMRVAIINSFARVLNPCGGAYIYICVCVFVMFMKPITSVLNFDFW